METKDSLLSLLFLLTSVTTWLLLKNKYLAPCSVSSSLMMLTKSSLGQTTINTVWVRESSVKIYNKLNTSSKDLRQALYSRIAIVSLHLRRLSVDTKILELEGKWEKRD